MSEWASMEISTICNGDRTKFRTDDPDVMPSATFLLSYSIRTPNNIKSYSSAKVNSPEVLTCESVQPFLTPSAMGMEVHQSFSRSPH